MRLVSVAAIAALTSAALAASAVAQPAYDPPPLPPGCTGGANEPCALLDYTRRTLAPALAGLTLAPVPGQPTQFSATGTDRALPALRVVWIEERPVAVEPLVGEFTRGLSQPGQICSQRPHGQPTAIGRSFDLRCSGGQSRAIQTFLHVIPGRQRTAALALLAPLEHGPALLARGERAAAALAQAAAAPPPAAPATRLQPPYAPPPNYAQLRADCADDSDVAKQIAGCDAVLANPGEQTNHGIALNNRGHARERGGDNAAALADYERAIQQDPTYVTAYINRARVLARLGRTDEAIAALDAAIKIEDSGWARYERGRLLAAKRDWARSLADLEEAVRLEPGDAEFQGERDRVRAVQAAQATPAPPAARNPLEAAVLGAGRSYVGEALLKAPHGPLTAGDALSTYTRDLLAPGLPGLTLSPLSASSPLAFRGEAPGLPGLIVRWWDFPSAGTSKIQMHLFERELNGGCTDNQLLAQRGGEGARVVVYATPCPTMAPPYQLLWLEAFDRERSRLLLVAGPLAQGPAILAAGDRLVAALGM
ncbi:MAG TPA: tetratricopeptide repeat protein, partial [Salinarimonas sp.]|nr:tetratricopeptide repeat protein [Salinarimonas sp.]